MYRHTHTSRFLCWTANKIAGHVMRPPLGPYENAGVSKTVRANYSEAVTLLEKEVKVTPRSS